MRRVGISLAAALLCAAALCAPPTQDPVLRPQVCLNGEWQFQPADNALTPPSPDGWDKVPIRIPSPWNVNAFSRGNGGDFECFPSYPKSWETPLAAWHRRSFTVPDSMRGKPIFLRFDAVLFGAEVYVNGQRAGGHEGGFTPFELDVTRLVHEGAGNELLVGVKARNLYDVNGRTPYGWGSFWGETARGIWQDVNLIARPKLYVSDVFVMTSVEKREITLEITVTNLGDAPRTARINNHIFDADQPAPGSEPAKGFERVSVSLQPGETKTVTLREPWASPKLWWPSDPHLYVLVTRLYPDDDDNTPLDMRRTRFGFKDFRIGPDGRKFQLNGVTFSGRGDAWHFMGVPECTPAYARAWYEMAKSANANIIRLHAQVYPEYYLDVADEMGMLIVDETALWGSAINFWYNDDFLRRGRDHVRELVLRDRNHPSVALWSVANEIYARQGNDNAPDQDWIFARYAEFAAQMKALDPTREVSSDGDNDLGGRLNIYSYHYPGAGGPPQKKITTIGEAGSMYYSTPSEVAHAIGDRAYRTSTDRMDAVAIETADLIEGYRKWAAYAMPFNIAWYGLEPLPIDVKFQYDDLTTPGMKPERLGPYSTALNGGRDPKQPAFIPNPLYTAEKDAFEPVRFFVKERSCVFWGGQKVVRHFTIHNDMLEPSDLTLEWALRLKGAALASGQSSLSLKPGEMREVEVTVPMPEADRDIRDDLIFDARLVRGGATCYRQKLAWEVLAKGEESYLKPWVNEPGGVAIYDPRGQTTAVLALLWIHPTRVDSPAALASAGARISVVGAGAGLSHADALMLNEKCGPLTVYEDNPAFYGDDMYATRHTGSYVRAFDHARWGAEGYMHSRLRFWGADGIVARAACGREVHGNVGPLVTCGDGELAAFVAWKGEVPRVFCELLVSEKGLEEAAAASMLAAIWDLAGDTSPTAPTAVSSDPRSRFAAAMASVGVQPAAETPEVLLCDGSRPPVDADSARAFVAASGTGRKLLVVGLTPETLDAWNAVLPVKATLEPSDAAQLIRADDRAEMTLGIDHHDLFWIEQNNTRRIMDYAVSCGSPEATPLLVTNHTDWRRWCWQGENVKTGAIIRSEREPFTPQTGLLQVPYAGGHLYVSQVRLDPMNPKPMGYYSQLLTNLGVPLRCGAATDVDMTPFNVDADGFISSWLVCGPFAAAKAHDIDLLGGDGAEAAVRPEPGTASGKGLWAALRSPGPTLDFTRVFGKLSDQVIYAAAWVKSPVEQTANLWVGSDDSLKAWVNGKLVLNNPAIRPCVPDSDKAPGVQLKQGWNLVLCKVTQGSGEWALCARLVDDAGKPLPDLIVSASGPDSERAWQAISREGWKATASSVPEVAADAIDADSATRWSTGTPQTDGQWFQLDLGRTETVARIVLDAADSPGDVPRGLRVEVSTDGQQWQTVCDCPNTGAAQQGGVLTVSLPPTALRYVKFTQTGPAGVAGGLWWSIHDLRLYR